MFLLYHYRYGWVCLWALFSVALTYLSAHVPVPHCLNTKYCAMFYGKMFPNSLFFKNILAILDSASQFKFQRRFSRFTWILFRFFTWILLNLLIKLGIKYFLNNIPSILENNMMCHFLMSFNKLLCFFSIKVPHIFGEVSIYVPFILLNNINVRCYNFIFFNCLLLLYRINMIFE